jgi:N-acetylglucosamine-6-phosphate deacetylase
MNALPIPGFVDLQVNGHMGIDFSDPNLTEVAFVQACDLLFQAGTAVFMPTVITSPLEVYERNLPIMAAVMRREPYRSRLPGIHLEGPFISPEPGAVGAHRPEYVRKPDVGLFQQINAWANHTLRIVTLAAELEGAEELARHAAGQGILVSSGHSLATPADLARLATAGASALTHLGNGLPHLLHKYNNPLWSGLADDRYTAMMIGDGHHIPGGVLKAMIRAKGIAHSIIVSDAAPVAGLPPGNYTMLGNDAVLEPSGLFHNPKIGYLVGSSYTMVKCMNYLASLQVFSLEELLDLGFYNPLRLIGLDPASIPTQKLINFDSTSQTFRCQV